MTDNPAVRAVADVVERERDGGLSSHAVATLALSAVASSQEVREWLRERLGNLHGWEPGEQEAWTVEEVLHALRGGS